MYLEPPWKRVKHSLPNIFEKKYNENAILQTYMVESLGSFNKQYDLAEDITDNVIEMMMYGIEEKEIMRDINGMEKKIIIVISQMGLFNAQITEIRTDSFKIVVNLSRFNQLSYGLNSIKTKLKETIAHELMHSYIIYSRFHNDENVNDIPDYYGMLTNIYNDESENGDIREISYALYATLYHERQSIVSQTFMSLNALNPNHVNVERHRWIEMIQNSDPYIIFNNILLWMKKMKNYNLKQKNIILGILNDKGINISNFDKMIQNIEGKATIGLKDVTRNAVLYFEKLEEKYKKKK